MPNEPGAHSSARLRPDVTARLPSPRRLARLFVLILAGYFVLGTASQKLVPGAYEVFPLFGWSLFSRVPGPTTTYRITIHEFDGRPVEPPVALLDAPKAMVRGDRFIARKVIQRLGAAQAAGKTGEVERLRRLLERSYLRAATGYDLTVERYQPLDRWRGLEVQRTVLERFASAPDGAQR